MQNIGTVGSESGECKEKHRDRIGSGRSNNVVIVPLAKELVQERNRDHRDCGGLGRRGYRNNKFRSGVIPWTAVISERGQCGDSEKGGGLAERRRRVRAIEGKCECLARPERK